MDLQLQPPNRPAQLPGSQPVCFHDRRLYVFTRQHPPDGRNMPTTCSLTWSYKYALSATLSYSHISDLFTTVPDTTDRSKTVTSSVNLASQDIVGANVSYSFQYKWYSAFLNINGFYASYRANFGAGKNIDLNVFNTTITSQHNIQLAKGWSASLTQYYTSREYLDRHTPGPPNVEPRRGASEDAVRRAGQWSKRRSAISFIRCTGP